jgi:hypothetical protein
VLRAHERAERVTPDPSKKAMQAARLDVKLYFADADGFDVEPFVPTLHSWIKDRVLDEQLLDVANYSHVHQGPGVVLVGFASDYSIDLGEGRPGLRYLRKREAPAEDARILDAFRRALNACRLLESDPYLLDVHFKTDEVLFRAVDRLRIPSTDEGYRAMETALRDVAQRLYQGCAVEIARHGGDRDPVGLRVTARNAPDLGTLLERAGGAIEGAG